MKVRGELAELLVRTDPTLCTKYVTIKNNQQVLYVELLNALYELIKVPLLFFQKFVKIY